VQNGRLSVTPYETSRTVNIKMRWRGRKLHEVMGEFGYDHDYVEEATRADHLQLNGRHCEPADVLENGDVLKHSYLVQEPSVVEDPILVLAENEHVLVVKKPAGLPCHPQGKYQRCSLTEIIRASHLEDKSSYLHPVNRLDRQTSGVVILAKSRKAYMALAQEHGLGLRKVYVARVCSELDLMAAARHWPQSVEVKSDGKELVCKLPLRVEKHVANQPLKVLVDLSDGKAAETRFYTSSSDLVFCLLETGRTHQIRVHLAALGCPIVGDSLYGSAAENEDNMCLHAAAYSLTSATSLKALDLLPTPVPVTSQIPGLSEILPGGDATTYMSTDPAWFGTR
ncbi:unnamed protein product, partial [Durusdinium trenchii]